MTRETMRRVLSVMLATMMLVTSLPMNAYAMTDGDGNVAIVQADDSGSGSYMDVDASNIAQQDSNIDTKNIDKKYDASGSRTGGSSLVNNATSVTQEVLNTVLLPIALIVLVVRLLYIAIFPLAMGWDPFDVLDFDTWRGGPQANLGQYENGHSGADNGKPHRHFGYKPYDWGGKGDWKVNLTQEAIVQIMKDEIIGSIKALVVIIIVWGLLNLALWGGGNIITMLAR